MCGDNSPVAIIIPNYNMPEQVHELRSHIKRNTKWAHKIIVVNNGNTFEWQRNPDIIELPEALEMTHAVLMGLHYADALEAIGHKKFKAYWILITSMKFLQEKDYVSPIMKIFEERPEVVMANSSITGNSWDSMEKRSNEIRDVWGMDNDSVFIRADWFNKIGRYDPELTMAWGSALETCWIARKQGKKMCVDDRLEMKKLDGIAHEMGRRKRTRKSRNERCSAEMHKVLERKYGENFLEKLGHEYR